MNGTTDLQPHADRHGRGAPIWRPARGDTLPPLPPLRFAALTLVVLAALLAPAYPLHGQAGGGDPADDEPPTEGALFLLLPVSAKAVGLGRAMTAMPGPESVWWNAAGLGELDPGRRLLLYRGDHPVAGDATAVSFLLTRAGLGSVGFSYQLMDVGTQDVTDADGFVIGTLTPRNHLGVLSAATRFGRRLSLGANLKVVQFRLSCRGQCIDAGVTATSFAADAGAQLTGLAGFPLRLGAMIAHAGSGFRTGPDEEADPLPTRARFAAAYEILGHLIDSDEFTLSFTAELEDRWRSPGSPATYLGTEFTAGRGDVLYVRAGYVFGAQQQLDGAAVGVGLHYERFDLGLAKSLAASPLSGESEPVHISFGLTF